MRLIRNIRDRLLRKLTLIIYYYVPVLFAYLNPLQRRSNVVAEHAGSLTFPGGRFAVFVLWQRHTVPWYVLNMLDGLKRHHVNTIIVSNDKLSAEQLETLKGLSTKVLVRRNKGLDFGAYKDAVLKLMQGEEAISRLLILNDSVYVVRDGLDELLEDLLSEEYPVVAAYENWELHYHFQSFCLALSGATLNHPKVRQFWRRYRPISIRRWCIDHGEVKLSNALRKVAPQFKVIFEINDLLEALGANTDWATILQYREFIPRPIRKRFPSDDVLSMLAASTPQERSIILRRLKERMSDLLMTRAQAHTGCFFFPKFLSSPFLKRDIVYRELFTLYEVERMLDELGWTDETAPIVDEIRRRGTAAHLRGFAKIRSGLGLI